MARGFEKVERFKNLDIKLPERSTKYSAGYDFYAPEDIIIPSSLKEFQENGRFAYDNSIDVTKAKSEETNYIVKPFVLRTGIKAYMENDEFLALYIRSSSPSKLGLVMANSVAVIDKDYYGNQNNDGEIGFLIYNLSPTNTYISKGDKIGQGIFQKYLLTDDDNAEGERNGGYGSTGR